MFYAEGHPSYTGASADTQRNDTGQTGTEYANRLGIYHFDAVIAPGAVEITGPCEIHLDSDAGAWYADFDGAGTADDPIRATYAPVNVLSINGGDPGEAMADGVLNAVAASYDAAGTIGEKINDAAAAGTPPTTAQIATAIWTDLLASTDFDTALSIGKLLKDSIDATISSRMATFAQPAGFLAATFPATVASPTNVTSASGVSLTVAYDPAKTAAQAGDAMALTSGERTTLTAVIWNALTSGMTTVGSIGKKLADWVIGSPMQAGSTVVLTDASLTTAKLGTFVLAKTTNITGFNDLSAAQVNTEADTALADVGVTTTVTGRIDTTISSRASQTSLDTLDDHVDTEVAAIKAKTDQFVFTIANQVDANALSGATGLDAAGVRAAVGLAAANLDGQLDALPTNAELATALGTADDAVLAAIAALNNLSTAQVATLLTALEADLITDHGAGLWTRNTEPDNATIGTTGTAVAALTTAVADVPTAIENADAALLRDWTAIVATVPDRCLLQAARALRNRMSTITNAGFVTFYKEDDTTEAFSKTVITDSDAEPITEA